MSIRLGDFTIHRIIEQEAAFRPALEALQGLTPEVLAENRGWMQPKALDAEDRLVLCFQSYVVQTPHHNILIDSCIGNDKERPQRPSWHLKKDAVYMEGLRAIGLKPDDIDFVLCTHLHADHVGWNTKLQNGRWVPTFGKARYVFSKDEYAYWSEQNGKTEIPAFNDSVLPVVEAKRADLIGHDFAIGDHLRLMPTPGHTPDHVSVLLGKGRDEAVMTGDLVHSPLQARYPEMSVMFDVDKAQAARTRRSFFEHFCDTDTLCCTAHFPSPSMGHIKRWGDGFRCEFVAD